MLQNRVDPWGNIIATSARGSWMGNRGLLHDEHQQIRRPFRLKAWLICRLEFKGRKRPVMAPRQYTELFFLDEATAFSAGHRPCFECRRADALRFKSFWLKGNPEHGFNAWTPIQEIDAVLHRERISPDGRKVMYEERFEALPDGSFVLLDGEAWLVCGGFVYRWTPEGYEEAMAVGDADGNRLADKVSVLTPRSVVNAFRAGYVAQMGLGR